MAIVTPTMALSSSVMPDSPALPAAGLRLSGSARSSEAAAIGHTRATSPKTVELWLLFWTVAVPLARPGFLTGGVLGFAHTVGEFGVVLMIGGNIPGQTKAVSYTHLTLPTILRV